MTAHDMPETVPSWYRPQPRSPHQVYGVDVIKDVQRTLCVPETGEWDETTINHLKGLQYVLQLPATGIIDQATAVQIERLRNRYAV